MGGNRPICKRKGYAQPDETPKLWQLARVSGHLMNKSSKMEEIDVLRVEVEVLRREHRDLDEAIHALHDRGSADMLTLRRLKKQKLLLKDKITRLEDRILPDIIA